MFVEAVFVDAAFARQNSLTRRQFCLVRARFVEVVVCVEELVLALIGTWGIRWFGSRFCLSLQRRRKRETCEVRVTQSLLRRDSLLRVENHHLLHQVNCVFGSVRNKLLQRSRHKLGERKTNQGSKTVTLGPLSLRWTAQHSTRLIDLVGFIVTREQRPH